MRRPITVLAVIIGFVAILNGVVLYRILTEPDPFDPLGVYPEQEVTSEQPIPIDGRVQTNGTKCNRSDRAVHVAGEVRWQSDNPIGVIHLVSSGVDVRQAGCVTLRFSNPVPEVVAAEVETGGPTRWRIAGTEWPIGPNGERGEPRDWVSEPFTLTLHPTE